MPNTMRTSKTESKTSSKRFAELFHRLAESEDYLIDALKVEIAEQIYAAMEQQNVKKAELARRLGTSRAYVTKLLQGNVNFTIDSLVKVARVLDCQLDIQLAYKHLERHWEQPHKEAPAGRVLQWRNRKYVQESVGTPIVRVEKKDASVPLVA